MIMQERVELSDFAGLRRVGVGVNGGVKLHQAAKRSGGLVASRQFHTDRHDHAGSRGIV